MKSHSFHSLREEEEEQSSNNNHRGGKNYNQNDVMNPAEAGAAGERVEEVGRQSAMEAEDGENLYEGQFRHEMKRITKNASINEKMKAFSEIGQMVYVGGKQVEELLKRQDEPLELMVEVISSSTEPFSYRMQALQSIAVICHTSKLLQHIFLSYGIESIITSMILDEDVIQDFKYWAVNVMLSLATRGGHTSVYFSHEAFQMAVEEIAEWEWGNWGNNDAVDLMGFFSSKDLVRRSSKVRRSLAKRGSVSQKRRQTASIL